MVVLGAKIGFKFFFKCLGNVAVLKITDRWS